MNRSLMVLFTILFLVCSVVADAQPPGRSRGRFPFGFGGRGPMGGGSLFIVAVPQVQRELKARPEQEKLLEALLIDLAEQRREALMRAFARPSEDQDERDQASGRQRLAAFTQQSEQLLATIFEPQQAARLNELRLQSEGIRALQRLDVAGDLGLSDDQQQRIQEVMATDTAPRPGTRGDDTGRTRDEMERQVLAVLTDTQQEQWVKMQGETFTFPTPENRFGRRGFRGPGRDGDRPPRGRGPSPQRPPRED